MKVFVVGGTRFIGAHAVRHLVRDGHDVTVFHRGNTNTIEDARVGEVFGDRNNMDQLRTALNDCRPDVVIDMVAHSSEHATSLIEAASGHDRRIVAISSGNIYRGFAVFTGDADAEPSQSPLREGDALRDEPVPGDDKRSMEATYQRSGLPVTFLRLPMVYGPGDPQHRLFDIVRRVRDNRGVVPVESGFARCILPRGYVENVAAAISLAATDARAAGRIYNVADEEPIDEACWIQQVLDVAGSDALVVRLQESQLPDHLKHGATTEQSIEMDTSLIRAELGFKDIVDRSTAIRRTIEWELANPPEPTPDPIDYAAEDAAVAAARKTSV